MKSRIIGRNYEILESDDDIYSVKINKKKLDKALLNISSAFETVLGIMHQTYQTDEDYELYHFLNEILHKADIDCEDGDIWKLRMALDYLKDIQDTLNTHNDEIKLPEFRETLEMKGYTKSFWGYDREKLWEKKLEDTEEKEVTEQIFADPDNPVRRICTIFWEKTEGGRQSKSITYRKMPIGKKLLQIIKNSESELTASKNGIES